MYLIVGLGNPEPEYSQTRHNMGFDTINLLAKKHNIEINKNDFESIIGIGTIYNEKVILQKPQTYMNLSGTAILKAQNYYKIPTENIIVIYDDMDIPEGVVKLRKQGGAGTHNGMKSVIAELQSKTFPHVRIGIGKPLFKELMIGYVIQKMKTDEYEKLKPAICRAEEAVEEIVKNGIDLAMNRFN